MVLDAFLFGNHASFPYTIMSFLCHYLITIIQILMSHLSIRQFSTKNFFSQKYIFFYFSTKICCGYALEVQQCHPRLTCIPLQFRKDHEIFSAVILSLLLIQEGQLSVSGKRMCTVLVNGLEDEACPGKKYG